ncbi:MAG: phage baseplate assembly protein V, partial [Tabrizicola sp.]|nr:phage baseplate assembly protein V [Tabrizicola sp.]
GGAGWGGMVIPRIGMEVVVEFLEGDPDKPLVTGCVYNAKQTVPYPLPANKTVSTFRTQTHEGAGFNELRFEDQAGREEVFMHAQKDHNTVIENDESHTIRRDRRKDVTRDQVETIGRNKSIVVENNHTEAVKGNKSETITKDYSTTVTEGNQSVTVVSGTHTTTVKGDKLTTVQSGQEMTVIETGDRIVQVLSAGEYRTVKNDIVTVSTDGAVGITAATAVVIQAPSILLKANDANFIHIGQGVIVVEGGQTLINPREAPPG